MMLLVSLPEMESGGEGLRMSSACLRLGEAASDTDTGVSDTGVSWRTDEWSCRQALVKPIRNNGSTFYS